MAVDLEVTSKEYFSNLNPLTKKISVDIQSTREAYQEFWHSLSREDQHQVIDESIICPSAVIKYAKLPPPAIKDNPNVHSWFTKSQLNLFNQNRCNLGKPSAHNVKSETINNLEQSKKIVCNESLDTNKEKEISVDKTSASKVQKPSVLKPKIPPPPPPSKSRTSSIEVESSDDSSMVSASTDIPKTGFDFLDNW